MLVPAGNPSFSPVKSPSVMAGLVAITHGWGTSADVEYRRRPGKSVEFERGRDQNIELPVRAVGRSEIEGRVPVLGVELDRFNNQIKGVNAVDFAGHAIGFAGNRLEAFGEVQQAINTAGIVTDHQQERARAVFHP
jgi:hypothetical protein